MKLSIIIPIKYLNVSYYKRCVKSILDQSYCNFEIIIKCNLSEDEFLNIKQIFNDSRIRYFNSEDSSVTEAINYAIDYLDGDFVTVFSHDDCYTENSFQVLHDHINASYKWYIGNINYFVDDIYRHTRFYNNPTLENMKQANLVLQPASFWSSDLFKTVGKLDESFKLCWDYDFWIRLLKFTTPKPMFYKFANYYLNNNSISRKYADRMVVENKMILSKHFGI